MTDIFLSYTERDRETARRVAEVLGSAGWSVWWDRRIPAGETWRSVLEHALEDMRCMVVLWSAKSIESEWVYEEASEGRRLGKLVPVMIEAVRPPAGFREIQAADLTGWDGSPDFDGLRMLLSDLENLLGKPVGAAPERPLKPIDAKPGEASPAYDPADLARINTKPREWWRNKLAGVAGALLLAGAGYLALSGREPAAVPPQARQPEVPETRPGLVVPKPAPVAETSAPKKPAVVSVTAEAPILTEKLAQKPAARPLDEKVKTTRAPPIKARCAEFLSRVQLGESLSHEAQAVFQKECQQ
ncbi:MAG: TIR domain-containing protein [Betaproteobacteria bacterium]|nr:TIR domain-containing protein [Betaproteobacteria bacterium]MBP6188627.1 TIR domain-containing protein [Azonexus sp.]MBP6204278.1 TIR domain-containing protein [Azonexus sp.]